MDLLTGLTTRYGLDTEVVPLPSDEHMELRTEGTCTPTRPVLIDHRASVRVPNLVSLHRIDDGRLSVKETLTSTTLR